MRAFKQSLVFALLGGSLAELDGIFLMRPPSTTSDQSALLVYVPGGLVPNTIYAPILAKLQQRLSGTVDLWVSIAACPDSGTTGGLCFPGSVDVNITAAVAEGREASGVTDPKQTWLAGHSLGGVATDYHCTHDAFNQEIQAGCILMGDYVFQGTTAMLDYRVPVLTLLGEMNFGSSRPMKLAPYFKVADAAGPEQLLRTPIVVIKDIDHSDMCESFHVEGDLPSATTADEATDRIADLTSDFMLSQLFPETASERMEPWLSFTREYMAPMIAALDLDLYKAGWCEQVQMQLAGSLSEMVSVSSVYYDNSIEWEAPTATLGLDGKVEIVVTGRNTYESDAVWPPNQPWPFLASTGLQATVGGAPPAVGRCSPTSAGCRMISPSKIAQLLGKESPAENANFCKEANQLAWSSAREGVLQRTLDRYTSAEPCNGCSPGVQLEWKDDVDAGDNFGVFANMTLTTDFGETAAVIGSPSFTAGDERSCMLWSMSRALDFLQQDAYLANCYGPSSFEQHVIV